MIRTRLFAAAPLLFATALSYAADQPAGSAGSMFQMLFGLIVVLGVMVGMAWFLKRTGVAGNPAGSIIRVVGGVSVGNRERILVVEVADEWIVVGVTPNSINALSTMPRRELPAAPQYGGPVSANFAAWLKQTIEKRNGN